MRKRYKHLTPDSENTMKSYLDELNGLPAEVLWVKFLEATGGMMGASTYESIIKKYPEHFPEETEQRRRYESIPQEVHDAYYKEYWAFHDKLWEDEPPAQGLFAMINNTDEYRAHQDAYDRLRPIEEENEKLLYKKYYSKYGI